MSYRVANWSNTTKGDYATNGPIVLKPGQTLMCSLYSDENPLFIRYGGFGTSVEDFKLKPGILNSSLGFGVDWLLPDTKVIEPSLKGNYLLAKIGDGGKV